VGAEVAGAEVAGAEVAGADVAGADVAGAEVAGAWVAAGAPPPQATSSMLANTSSESKANKRFIFLSPPKCE
jgi:hypothetical protein